MLGAILGVGIPVISIVVAAVTWRTLYKLVYDRSDLRRFGSRVVATLGALIWPISLSLVAGFWIYEALSDEGRANRLLRKRQKELEIEEHKTRLAREVAKRDRLVAEERVKQLEFENRERKLLGLPTVTQ